MLYGICCLLDFVVWIDFALIALWIVFMFSGSDCWISVFCWILGNLLCLNSFWWLLLLDAFAAYFVILVFCVVLGFAGFVVLCLIWVYWFWLLGFGVGIRRNYIILCLLLMGFVGWVLFGVCFGWLWDLYCALFFGLCLNSFCMLFFWVVVFLVCWAWIFCLCLSGGFVALRLIWFDFRVVGS